MRYMLAAAAVAMSAGAAQAAVVDLTYTVEAEATAVQGFNGSQFDFEFTRRVGDTEFLIFNALVDTETQHNETILSFVGSDTFYSGKFSGHFFDFDPQSGAGQRPCCAKPPRDSHCGLSGIAGRDDQTCPDPLPHPELARLQRCAARAWIADGLV